MILRKYVLFFLIVSVIHLACGVKGPPLPPLVIIPQKTEPQPTPLPSTIGPPTETNQDFDSNQAEDTP